jgi:hypothetical protein
VPPKPDYFRVKVRRRLQRIGAVALKNSVYVLPNTDEGIEDLHWLRRAIVDEGGEAILCAAGFVEGMSDEEVEGKFRAQAEVAYDAVIAAAETVAADLTEGDLRRLERHLAAAAERDFFSAANAMAAWSALRELERELMGPTAHPSHPVDGRSGTHPRGVTWVTRAGVFVDRMASAWLIRRFIDPEARFRFVPAGGYQPAPGELRFDMFEGEYTHEGDNCTFEVLISRFGLRDAALKSLAEIVHDIDCKDEKFGRSEAIGLEAVLRGIASQHEHDAERISAGVVIFDGLYAQGAVRDRSSNVK